jgi:hypothetical protein
MMTEVIMSMPVMALLQRRRPGLASDHMGKVTPC